MLEHLRQRVIQALADAHTATLSTYGPAGLQSSRLACEASGTELYLLVPRTSDHLFNLETERDVTLVNETWHMNGSGQVVRLLECPPDLGLVRCLEAGWSEVVRVRPRRVTILWPGSKTPAVTIDVD